VTELPERTFGGGPHLGMVGEPQVVVGAEVDHVVIARVNERALRPGDHPLALVEPLLAQAGEVTPQPLEKYMIHKADYTEAFRSAVRAGGRRPATAPRAEWVAFEPPKVVTKHVREPCALQTATYAPIELRARAVARSRVGPMSLSVFDI